MSDDATVVWLAEGEPSQEEARALEEWARARGLRLSPPDDGDALGAEVDLGLADEVEKDLERARDAIAALDADAAERSLARAEAILRAHPELPQAAWLRAEVERGWSARFLRAQPHDEERARTAWQNARAIDGGRVPGVGETAFEPRDRAPVTIAIGGGEGHRLTLRLDGAVVPPPSDGGTTYRVEIAPAEHQVLVEEGGATVFAAWVAITPEASGAAPTVHVALPSARGACTRAAFAGVSRLGGAVRAEGASCGRWVAAAPGARPGAVLVARCERDACGPLLEWRVERMTTVHPPQDLGPQRSWPAWATWTLVGLGAATATSVALVASGVFESPPVEQRFVAGGARVE